MALISHKHRFIYMKTFKTGGTSTEMALELLCAPPGHKPAHLGPGLVSEYGIVGARGARYMDEQTEWQNHMPASAVAEKLGAETWGAYRKIASIRNPFDKAVSWYWFMRTRGKGRLGHGESVAEFRAFLAHREAKGYFRSRRDIDWRVTHIGEQPVIDSWVRLEHLEADLAAVCEAIGADFSAVTLRRAKNRTRSADALPVPAYYDQKTADILRRNQDWIFEAGGYSPDPQDAVRVSNPQRLGLSHYFAAARRRLFGPARAR